MHYMQTLTKQGYNSFVKEVDDLQISRATALKDMVQMRELGDLSENAGYRAARSKLNRIDNRIRYLNKLLSVVRVIDTNTDTSVVRIGTKITINDGIHTKTYSIVDPLEGNLAMNKISTKCPLGKALLGKRVNESVKMSTPTSNKIFRVLKIESM